MTLIWMSTDSAREAYSYALSSLLDNEHDKGCDESCVAWYIESAQKKIAEVRHIPGAVRFDLGETFSLALAAQIYGEGADEITEVPGTAQHLGSIARLLDPVREVAKVSDIATAAGETS